MNQMKILVPLSLVLLAGGCADTLHDRRSVAVEVIPVKHTYSVEVKEDTTASANEIENYIDQNWELIAKSDISLISATDAGEVLSQKTLDYLLKKGKEAYRIESELQPQQGSFDFSIQAQFYQTVTPVCDYYQIGYFGEAAEGCYVEGARWQSLVTPQTQLK